VALTRRGFPQKLLQTMDGTTVYHYKEMLHTIKYTVDTKYQALLIQPKGQHVSNHWNLHAYCDGDYSGDKDTHFSMTGFVSFIQNVPISWKSRGQKSVTLSSTEAKYVALSEVCMEIMFVNQIMEFLKLEMVK